MGVLHYISPAKSLRHGPALGHEGALPATEPLMLARSNKLARALRAYDAAGLSELMEVSEKIAALNLDRNKRLHRPPSEDDPECRRAAFCFHGDAYEALRPETLDLAGVGRMGAHLRILSGFYGLLRPGDLIRPHRLEMGRRPAGIGASSLYEFWGASISKLLAEDAQAMGAREALSLASEEYDRAASVHWSAPIPLHRSRFETQGATARKVVSFDAKRARGLFCRHLASGAWSSVAEASEAFGMEGWRLDRAGPPGALGSREWTFVKGVCA